MNSVDTRAIDKLIAKLEKQGVETKTLPTAIYARKSTKDRSEASIDSQIEKCTKFISEDSRLDLIRVYSEENKSGYFAESRDEFAKLIQEIKAGTIKVVVCNSLDRASRNALDGETLDKMLANAGAIMLYVTQAFEDNSSGRLVKRIVRNLAQYEPEKTAEDAMRTSLKKAKNLEFNGGRVPYGYKVIEKKYVIDEDEAKGVRLMFDLTLAGSNVPQVISALESKGIRTRENKPFSPQTVERILKSVKYKGTYLYNDKGGRKRKLRVLTEEYDEVRVESGIPGIVKAEVFDKVQAIVGNKRPKGSNKAKETYALTGLLVCGCCGDSMRGYASFGGHSKKRYTNYTCRRRSHRRLWHNGKAGVYREGNCKRDCKRPQRNVLQDGRGWKSEQGYTKIPAKRVQITNFPDNRA